MTVDSATKSRPSAEDPHLTREWFELLETTAIESDARVMTWALDTDDPTEPCELKLFLDPQQPGELKSLSTFYTPVFGPTGTPAAMGRMLASHFARVRREMPGVTRIRLAPMDPDSAFFGECVRALRAAGWWADAYFCFGNWFGNVSGLSFDEYMAQRSSKLRNTVTRARKKLDKDPTFRLEIHRDAGPALDQAIADYVEVYNQSWKKPEPFPEFIPGLCRLAARKGWLRLGILHLDGRPVAAQIWLSAWKTVHIVKLAYVQDYAKRTVGSVLTTALMKHVLDEDRVEWIDYLIGDDAYKRDWTPERRERHGIIAFDPRSMSGLAGGAKHYGGRLISRLKARRKKSTKPSE